MNEPRRFSLVDEMEAAAAWAKRTKVLITTLLLAAVLTFVFVATAGAYGLYLAKGITKTQTVTVQFPENSHD